MAVFKVLHLSFSRTFLNCFEDAGPSRTLSIRNVVIKPHRLAEDATQVHVAQRRLGQQGSAPGVLFGRMAVEYSPETMVALFFLSVYIGFVETDTRIGIVSGQEKRMYSIGVVGIPLAVRVERHLRETPWADTSSCAQAMRTPFALVDDFPGVGSQELLLLQRRRPSDVAVPGRADSAKVDEKILNGRSQQYHLQEIRVV
ncbi:hypothetical protein B9Z65_8003 [Elsinoe australis]|uniref:Uncharacterized protein n=1 Tax=Elsinoe australis TaxID=40998 RepID=A0A2P7YVS8_9PEZI|nr:hypothetical protein B9Z65_8003 [Elsinoe australis]